MAGGVVGQVLEAQGRAGGEHVVGIEFEAGALQQFNRFFHVGLFREIAVAAVRVLPGIGILEVAAVAVRHAQGQEGGSDLLLALADGVNDVLTVDQQAQGLPHRGSLFSGLAGEEVGLDVEDYVVGAQLVHDVELGISFQRRDLIGGNAVDEVQVAVLIGGENGGIVIAEHELQALDLHVVGIPVVGVLDVHHGLVVLPALQGVGTAGNKAGFQRPGTGVVRGGLGFDTGLLHREEGGEGGQVQHVGAGGLQGDGEGLAVFGSGDLQIIRIAGDAVEHVAVVSSGFGSGSALPGILEVLRGQVRPSSLTS